MKNILWYLGVGYEPLVLTIENLIVGIVIDLVIAIAFYVLRSVALYTIAKRQNINKPFLAFIPCAWLFIAGKAMGTVLIKGKPAKNLPLIATIVFALSEVIALTCAFIAYFPIVGYYLQGGNVIIADTEVYTYVLQQEGFVPYVFFKDMLFVKGGNVAGSIVYPYADVLMMRDIVDILGIIAELATIAVICFNVIIYIGLFRKFIPAHYLIFTVLSVVGLFPIMVFIVRKKEPVNYKDYIRSRFYGRGYNPYMGGNPYANNSAVPQERKEKEPENPFSEFDGDKKEDKNPFDM